MLKFAEVQNILDVLTQYEFLEFCWLGIVFRDISIAFETALRMISYSAENYWVSPADRCSRSFLYFSHMERSGFSIQSGAGLGLNLP